ncbi:MAG: insulinase family protein [Coriobacteriales bacterium]|nr:insulinase family protein [Coriobacteriales bacterium]
MHYEKSTLSNGITVLTDTMPDVRSIALGIWFRVGARDESKELSGMSHFMEHMTFKGTETHSALDIMIGFDSLGAESNALTGKEATCYYARFVDEKLVPCLELLADMVLHSKFDPAEVAMESKVVIEEIARSEDDPSDYVHDLQQNNEFPDSPVGRRVLGTRENIERFTQEDFVKFRDERYIAQNCFIAACGNVEHERLVELCEELFKDMPQGERTQRSAAKHAPAKRFVAGKKDTEQAHVIITFPGIKATDDDRYAAAILFDAFGGGMSSRLFQEIREKRGLVYTVLASGSSLEHEGISIIYAGTRASNLPELVEAIMGEVDKLRADGLTAEELDRSCNAIVGSLLLSQESTRTRMIKLGRYAVTDYPYVSVDESVANYKAVTLEDTQRVIERVFSAEPTIAIVSSLESDEVFELVREGMNL